MKLLWKYIQSHLLTGGLIAGVFLLIRYNPLGLLSSTKISLSDTPTVIKELKELGEFVTSAYSGETIESLQEGPANEMRIIQRKDSLSQLFGQMQQIYPTIARTEKKEKNRRKAFEKTRLYQQSKDDIRLLGIAAEKTLGELLDYSISDNMTWSVFAATHQQTLEKAIDDNLNAGARKKIKVAYIGRGRVKAGFDLRDIDNPVLGISLERNATLDTLVIRNLDPEILDADINPWFIYRPEANIAIPGYELLKLKKPKQVDFSDITAVKMACKQSLINQALYDREILAHAIASGETTFRDLFNLFRKPDEPPLAAVRIEPTPYYEFKAGILKDRRVEASEIRDIRIRLTQDGLALNTPAARALILSIGKRPEWLVDPVSWQGLRSEAGL
jgi:hypothetical protein